MAITHSIYQMGGKDMRKKLAIIICGHEVDYDWSYFNTVKEHIFRFFGMKDIVNSQMEYHVCDIVNFNNIGDIVQECIAQDTSIIYCYELQDMYLTFFKGIAEEYGIPLITNTKDTLVIYIPTKTIAEQEV